MNHFLKNHYKIVIIGAGPAGLNAAKTLCDGGVAHDVLLVDKQATWEKPIACAEAVGKCGFHDALSVSPQWIRYEINSAAFFSPSNQSIVYTDKPKGYIINRARMQQDLFVYARENGIECYSDRRVKCISLPKDDKREIVFEDGTILSANIVIDASGPLSTFGRTEAIAWKSLDLEPALFSVVDNVTIRTDSVYVYMDSVLAPGGYAWVFPREGSTVNIGIVLGKKFTSHGNIKNSLSQFISSRFPDGKILSTFAGSIPCGVKRRTIAVSGLIKTGDAASTVNPISRAGIVESLLSGKLAAQAALQLLKIPEYKKQTKICNNYEKNWFSVRGKKHYQLAKAKNSLALVPDEDFNNAVCALGKIPANKLTMSAIFKASVGRFPRLVWALRHLMV